MHTIAARLVAWLVGAMLAWQPAPEGANASEAAALAARYSAIASDAAAVALDGSEAPVFKGEAPRARTALLLLAIARYESHYEPEVEAGIKVGDNGRSWGLLQIQPHAGLVLDSDTFRYARTEDWAVARRDPQMRARIVTATDLVTDRRLLFRAGLHIVRDSFRACGDLTVYMSGGCGVGLDEARRREGAAAEYCSASPPPFPDDDVMFCGT